MEMPQIITVILISLNLFAAVMRHGEELKVNFLSTFFSTAITFALLFWGGFFG